VRHFVDSEYICVAESVTLCGPLAVDMKAGGVLKCLFSEGNSVRFHYSFNLFSGSVVL